ncbi:MAG: WYL domain-containing protein [Microlunatus sp.]|nr:WYL domain-containing protein [Microlunatus sp.]MDN5769911.1 WYL domain-containing protein [Microlunatus sp.]MDN5803882.1 WYL domain-containing protein [Microlunatus sp.]
MTARKTERILNLTICLLVSGRYLPKSQIRRAVEGYHDLSDAAFERTFERDKDELRSLGVPIEVGSFDPLFDDEPGYRIRPSEFELPPVELDADEAAVVGVAARVWQHASVAESTRSALAKLRAAGVEPDTSQLAALEPSVQAREEAFEPLWTAVLDRVRVGFTYRGGQRRSLEPWGMTASKGRWYVIGWDTDKQATRMFKLSRITDKPRRTSKVGAYQVPDDLDLRALARALDPGEPNRGAVVSIRAGKGATLRRRGTATIAPTMPSGAGVPAGFETLAVGFADLRSIAEEIVRYGADVIVHDPPELRSLVLDLLTRVAATASAPGVSAERSGQDQVSEPVSA